MSPTVRHATRISSAIGDLDACTASQQTCSSKTRVNRDACRAHGTAHTTTPWGRQRLTTRSSPAGEALSIGAQPVERRCRAGHVDGRGARQCRPTRAATLLADRVAEPTRVGKLLIAGHLALGERPDVDEAGVNGTGRASPSVSPAGQNPGVVELQDLVGV